MVIAEHIETTIMQATCCLDPTVGFDTCMICYELPRIAKQFEFKNHVLVQVSPYSTNEIIMTLLRQIHCLPTDLPRREWKAHR